MSTDIKKDIPSVIIIGDECSIAISYNSALDKAPVVLAKASDRDSLKQEGVAVVENPSLAKELYESIDIGEEIAEEFYEPMAKALAYANNIHRNRDRKDITMIITGDRYAVVITYDYGKKRANMLHKYIDKATLEIKDIPNIAYGDIKLLVNEELAKELYDSFDIGDDMGDNLHEDIRRNIAYKNSEQEMLEGAALRQIMKVDLLELDLGSHLVPVADTSKGGDLLERIKGMRRKIAGDYGFPMPSIRIRDNSMLDDNSYQFLLKGCCVGEGKIFPDKMLAIDKDGVTEKIDGEIIKEPAFGFDAIWIKKEESDNAKAKGYAVVEPVTVISTHISELVKKYADEILTRDEVYQLISSWEEEVPHITKEAVEVAGIQIIQHVLKELLHERVPIKDYATILETIADITPKVDDNPYIVIEHVRSRLKRTITETFRDKDGAFNLSTFGTATEQFLLDKLEEKEGQSQILLDVNETNALIEGLTNEANKLEEKGINPIVLIVDPTLRKVLSEKLEQFGLDIVVLSHAEIDANSTFEVEGTINIEFSKQKSKK